jgi:DNA-binding NarL/FixJ family response regulator
MRREEKRARDPAGAHESQPGQAAEPVLHSAARRSARHETEAAVVRELNGPLTALLLYMGEIKRHSHALARSDADKAYLKKIVENALEQTERLCALVGRIAGAEGLSPPGNNAAERRGRARHGKPSQSAGSGLTSREREVLTLIGEGYTNKQGAQEMRISPRTFESHRAEIMRKLGARNTADLVRAAMRLAAAAAAAAADQ